jgi:hypothetical protein
MKDLRSNIGYETQYDISLRNQVYDEYEKYMAWKRTTNKYDVGDLVLRLLEEEWDQHFASGKVHCENLNVTAMQHTTDGYMFIMV